MKARAAAVRNGQRPPTRAELEAASRRTVPDIIRPGLDVLFIGINPGLYTAAVGRHFGRPGNRFWPALNASGLLRRPLSPFDSDRLLESNLGITNLVGRATATAAELGRGELRRAAKRLERKLLRYRPRQAAFLGLGLYREAFDRPDAGVGPRPEMIGRTRLWVFPNPSGLNAHFQVRDYARMFRLLRQPRPASAGPRPTKRR
ncbi:MAG: mismatch-specific DNA-glycosylase [Elusimicrobia bacterium]|nr:mismatch-specific DNA-glycosylase [Elusimicrobiota bacterium]MDE2236532.1 mismatch-specific DNA-glycosylase [Elusimicrobiota bacterium]MDE2426810.1 mismatch-specific DNA-glycosylase [Elusimicrobiota bacterium]